jgi:hypothetical protein
MDDPALPSDSDKDLGCVNPGPSEPFIPLIDLI